jgi:hypothetical protein
MEITGVDGVHHINIYSKGKTELGRWLSNFAHSPIDLPEDGHFESIEGYWYWLGTRDERLRTTYGFRAKEIGRQRKPSQNPVDFEERIKRALDTKLKSNLAMLTEFAVSILPFRHYYEWGKPPKPLRRKDGGYPWIIEHLEARRKLLKEQWL